MDAFYASPALARPGEITITPWSYQSLGTEMYVSNLPVTSQNWPTANLVIYVPFSIPEPMMITKLFWGNGAAVAGNYDVGVYDSAGTRLVSSGSTGQSGTSRLQVVDVIDTVIARGLFYLALCGDTAGSTSRVLACVPAAGIAQSFGLLQQASVTLPLSTNASPATFAIYATALIPLVGLQGYRTGGP